MITIYLSDGGRMLEQDQICPGAWIHLCDPSEKEIGRVCAQLHIDPDLVRAALDEEERSRIEMDEGEVASTLILVDTPLVQTEGHTFVYSTIPFGIVLTPQNVITVCLRENAVVNEISQGLVKNIQTHLRTQFLLNILLRIATRFLQYLKQIDKISYTTENLLQKTMRNKELIQILGLEKSLVYFSTSLKSNEVTLEKILRGRIIKLYDEDEDLLEDVIIEVKQAIEMCSIYSNVLSNTMDAFSSIINNNLNIVMKLLAALTIIMELPNIIFGLYGTNVVDLPYPHFWFVLVLAAMLMLVFSLIFWKKDMFR